MDNMITIYDEDYCIDCDSEHSLMICNENDSCMEMSKVLENPSILARRELEYIKCKKCNIEYNIDWSRVSRVPTPLVVDIKLNQFIEDFKQNNKYI